MVVVQRAARVVLPTSLPDLAYIGDSLTAARVPQITSSLPTWKPKIDGLSGRAILGPFGAGPPFTADVISAWRAASYDPSKWVISLGTNGVNGTAGWQSSIATTAGQLLDLIASTEGGTVRRVWWVGLCYPVGVHDDYCADFQTILNGFHTSRTDLDVRPIDLNTAFHAQTSDTGMWQGTGPHMTDAGYSLREQIISTAIGAPGAP